jgi:flagellar protein FliL
MAKPPPKPAPAAEPAPAAGGSKKKLIMIVVAVLVLAGGGAAAFMMMTKSDSGGAAPGAAPQARPAPNRGTPPVYVTMDPFTTNLSREEGERFIQIVMVIKLIDPKMEPELKLVMPELRHRVNLILTAKKPSELSTMEGREILAEEVMIEANDVMGYPPDPRGRAPSGPVDAILFNSFIIQ